MSLAEQPLPLRELDEKLERAKTEKDNYSEDRFDQDMFDMLDQMDEAVVIEEATMASPKEAKKAEFVNGPPALPQRSSLRKSRFMEDLKIEVAPSALSTPHESYLSSEEDISSSADEFSEYDYDSASEQNSPIRKSHEDTARLVSVVFVGKPAIIQVSRSSHSRDGSLNSISSSDSSPPLAAHAVVSRPPRQSSLFPAVLTKTKPAFLNTDPYNGNSYKYDAHREAVEDNSTPRTPKTNMLRTVTRTINLARKRSKPSLNQRYETGSREKILSQSNSNLLNTSLPEHTPESVETSPDTPTQSHVTYNDILRSVRKIGGTTEPVPLSLGSSPDSSKRRILSLHVNRKKMLRP